MCSDSIFAALFIFLFKGDFVGIGDHADALHPGPSNGRHHANHRAVGNILVGPQVDRAICAVFHDMGQLFAQLLHPHLHVIDENLTMLIDAQHQGLFLGFQGFRRGFGQLHIHPLHHHGRGHHKDYQQYQH
ncbi:MAG: hypothetical protein WBG37_08765, partial [Desulfobacterales bacterium]